MGTRVCVCARVCETHGPGLLGFTPLSSSEVLVLQKVRKQGLLLVFPASQRKCLTS